MSGLLDSVKSAFSSSGEQGEGSGDQEEEFFFDKAKKKLPSLNWKQKVIGFGITAGLAALFAILGCALTLVSLVAFGLLFTIASICGVVSTLFLVGPISQAKKLIDRSNLIGMIIKIVCIVTFLVSVVLVLCAGFWWKQPVVAVLFCIIEFVALVVYAVMLIPFATTIISRGARSLMTD